MDLTAGVTKEQLLQICECGKDFFSRVIDILNSESKKASEKTEQPKVAKELDATLQKVHQKILECTKVNYPSEKENKYGRMYRRQRDGVLCFAFKPGKLEEVLAKNTVAKKTYLEYAKRTGKLVCQPRTYTTTVSIDRTPCACYVLRMETVPEPVFESKEEEIYEKIMELFKANEPKFDRREANEFGRRLSVDKKTCYAVRTDLLPKIISSFGGKTDEFIKWGKENGKIISDENKNTISVDFFNQMTDMYGLMRA